MKILESFLDILTIGFRRVKGDKMIKGIIVGIIITISSLIVIGYGLLYSFAMVAAGC